MRGLGQACQLTQMWGGVTSEKNLEGGADLAGAELQLMHLALWDNTVCISYWVPRYLGTVHVPSCVGWGEGSDSVGIYRKDGITRTPPFITPPRPKSSTDLAGVEKESKDIC